MHYALENSVRIAGNIIYTQEKKKRYTFSMEIHGVLFKVLDRDNEPSRFKEMLMNPTKYCLK